MTQQCFQDLIGKRYALGSSGPDAYDCWTLVLEVYRRLGWKVSPLWLLHDATAMRRRTEIIRMISDSSEFGAMVVNDPREFDIVCDLKRGHIGLWIPQRVLHASKAYGQVVLERFNDWKMSFPDTEFWRCHT